VILRESASDQRGTLLVKSTRERLTKSPRLQSSAGFQPNAP
jgi:hypothetical protein